MTELIDEPVQGEKRHVQNILENGKLLEENRKSMIEFFDHLQTRSPHTLRFYTYKLRDLDNYFNSQRPFKTLAKADVKRFLDFKGFSLHAQNN